MIEYKAPELARLASKIMLKLYPNLDVSSIVTPTNNQNEQKTQQLLEELLSTVGECALEEQKVNQ